MKLRLLSFLSLLACTFAGMQAQTSTNDVVFVNANGETIAPNSVLNVNKVEDDIFQPGQKQMHAELFISNRSDKSQKVKLSYTIVEMQEGKLQVCAFGDCTFQNATGTYHLERDEMKAAGKEAVSIEHGFATKGNCKIILQLFVKEDMGNGTMVEKKGPQLTINFVSETTGIASSPLQAGDIYDVYNTSGVLLYQQLSSLSKLPKGTYIVKFRNKQGTISTQKYVVS